MGRQAKNKGKRGEQELARWLRDHLPNTDIERNWESQAVAGGADIYLPPFAIEVKRQEKLSVQTWWRQANHQTTTRCPIPILAFRQNRKSWRFLFPARTILKKSLTPPPYVYVEVPPDVAVTIIKILLKK